MFLDGVYMVIIRKGCIYSLLRFSQMVKNWMNAGLGAVLGAEPRLENPNI